MQVKPIHAGFSAKRRVFDAAFFTPAAKAAFGDTCIGIEAYRSGDFETALKEFQGVAKVGDKHVQYRLGVMLLKGTSAENLVLPVQFNPKSEFAPTMPRRAI